jgi:hypothetical protein
MAERVVSPGVFTRERDLSFLEQGVANIGAAFVGVAQKGPAFIPVIVDSQTEFEERFGKADEYSYLGYTVQNYLQEAQSATVVRVLGLDGTSAEATTLKTTKLIVSGAGGTRVAAIFHPTLSGSTITSASVVAPTMTNVTMHLSSSGGAAGTSGTATWTAVNISGSSASSIRNAIGTNPYGTKPGYVYAFFPDAVDPTRGGITFAAASTVTGTAAVNFSGSRSSSPAAYTNAKTPYIRSQQISGNRWNLFKVHTLADGSNTNKAYKISIQSIKYQTQSGSFGTFSLLVRRGGDTDANPEILEQYDNLNLDPNSSDFIARRIGNSAPFTDSVSAETYYQGDYANKSRYVRIELSADAYGLPETALPYGFAALSTPWAASSDAVTPLVIDSAWSSATATGHGGNKTRDPKLFYGYDYTATNYTNQSYLAPIPANATTVSYIPDKSTSAHIPAAVTEFSLDNTRASEVDGSNLSITTSSHVTYRKFTIPMQGGYDGFKPSRERTLGESIVSTNTQGFDLSTSTTEGSVAFKKAVDAIKNPESFDINMLVIPGVNYEQHPYIAQYAIDVCEDRQDCFYIMDLASCPATVATAISTAASTDTNYAAGYYPWVKVLNTNTNRYVWAPPSVVLPEVFAFNDNAAAEWFAPAGLNRGGIPGATQTKSRLTRATRDELYENKVNPIATFPGQGIVAFGQKTLQKKASALDRINVRRLLIALKKFVASSSRYLVFEQNTEATRNRFLNIVNPYLASVQERQGLYAFRVVMDDTNNTPDVIDRNQLVGQIYLQPARAAEFIVLDFNIMPTGATFPGS